MTLRNILKADIPFDSVCFKDASGTCVPSTVHETIKRARKILGSDMFIHYHTHETAGISVQGNMAALDAGADAIDLSMAPCSGGTCQPDILVMWHALRGTNYTLDIDADKVREAEEVFKECMADYFLPPEAVAVEPLIPWSPMPGGALTANTQMLRDNGIMDRYPDMIRAMTEVVRKGGFGTCVTPVSQFYFQQAFNNVMFGPWQKIAEPYGKMVLGYFGKTPVPPDPEVVRLASEQLGLEPTTTPPLELNDADPSKGLAAARVVCREQGFEETEENLFIVATCGAKGVAFLKGDAQVGVRKVEKSQESGVRSQVPESTKAGPAAYAITVDGRRFDLHIDGDTATVNGKSFRVDLKPSDKVAGSSSATQTQQDVQTIHAQMPGRVLKLLVSQGDAVHDGQALLILEAMKMEVSVNSPHSGTVVSVDVAVGDQIASGQCLVSIA